MYHRRVTVRELFEWLLRIDQIIASEARSKGCGCGGRLDGAAYRRKPRGHPQGLGRAYEYRESLCCCRDGCRKRVTPPSVRFLGRRVYLGVIVVLAAATEGGVRQRRVELLRRLIGCPLDRRTVERWVEWWRETLPRSTFWKSVRSRFRTPVAAERMPLSVLEAFEGKETREAVVELLRLLAPVSAGHAW